MNHISRNITVVCSILLAAILAIMSVYIVNSSGNATSLPPDRPPKPTALAKYQGRLSSPEKTEHIHIYTSDPGALGAAMMWVYHEVAPNRFEVVFSSRIPSERDWDKLYWAGEHKVYVQHLDKSFYSVTTEISLP